MQDRAVSLPHPATPDRDSGGTGYAATRARVTDYFDRTATRTWERLTSDAPVGRIRATVRAGRERMRAVLLDLLPADLSGLRVLDAGCGTGDGARALAARGADVVAIDVSPNLVEIAQARTPRALSGRIDWRAGDMTDPRLGRFDHVLAMDSLIYYDTETLAGLLAGLSNRVQGRIAFSLAPRTALLTLMWRAGQMFPRADRAPTMVPQSPVRLARALRDRGLGGLRDVDRITSGFYISTALTLEGRA